MTIEEAKKILDKANDEGYSKDNRGKYKNRIRVGLQILEKYTDDTDMDVAFEHDQIFAGDFNENMTPEDVRELGLNGWFLSSETDGWSHF